MSARTNCKLCGLPLPTLSATRDGHFFCCTGCMEVYKVFGAKILELKNQSLSKTTKISGEGKEAFLHIDGMHCSSCEVLIEHLALRVEGILSATSSYATATAKVLYDPNVIKEEELPSALTMSGYNARLSGIQAPEYDYRQDLLRLLVGVTLAGLVMMLYVAFFYPTHLGLVEPSDLKPINWLAYQVAPWIMFVATTILLVYVGLPIFRGAWIGFRTSILNMDNLLAIAILAAYTYSVFRLLTNSLDLYFDVAATIIIAVTIGRHFERNARNEATKELSKIIKAWSPKARTRWGGGYQYENIDELTPGEHVLIWEGESIPIDGTIVYGHGAIDESLMTGEPFPVIRKEGDKVIGGSMLVDGQIEIQAAKNNESQMENLLHLLWNVQSSNAGAQGFADRVARFFVPVVIILAITISLLSISIGATLDTALLIGLATLIVSCPCTFGLAIPLTTAIGVSRALRKGIIFTSADSFEKARDIKIIAIDKTGTLSTGKMKVTRVIGDPEIAQLASAVELQSAHPIARAIAKLETSYKAESPENIVGRGASGTVNGRRIFVGSKSLFVELGWNFSKLANKDIEDISKGTEVTSFVGWGGTVHGAIKTSDKARPFWQQFIKILKRDYRIVLLTGAEHPSEYESQVDQVFSGIPPEGKAAVIRQLKTEGTVVMIGDGSNDAPALAESDLGIAFGAPTALAADAADIVIPGEELNRLFTALDIIHTIRYRSRQNLGWALLYNLIAIPIAALGLLNPLFAAIAMSSSSLLVVWNSSRKYKSLKMG
ncbi:MAG: Copper-exporting P-type ATPase A [Alphaproteobacteria bacterium MarineAlpha3_Bin5]|nr:MAG: Copper-exporting P-type ATPase A [Alphaproteobacteria bacterium MarineAlpha3_Bin5]